MVSREYDGLAGAGGVKDVCRQLAETLVVEAGVAVTVVLPRYGFIHTEELGFQPMALPSDQLHAGCMGRHENRYDVDMNYVGEERRERVSLWQKECKGVRVILIESKRFAEKAGVYTYTAQEEKVHAWQRQGNGHFDYFAMNILLQKAALDAMILCNEHPDIVHCQDGHAATLAAIIRETPGYRHYFRHSGVLVTIHNAGRGYHQEVRDLPFAQAVTGLPESVILYGRLAGSFDPFVAAARYAVINTVSENYARELQETRDDIRTGWLGHRLLQRGVRIAGVTNGINPQDFDPMDSRKLGLAAPFNPRQGDFAGKRLCKEAVLTDCGYLRKWDHVEQIGHLSGDSDLPLFTFVGRLTAQKGVDILLQSLMLLLDKAFRFQLLVLGSGEPEVERQLSKMTALPSVTGHLCFLKGYDSALATKIYAAGDFFLIPSLYEPCGLTDYIAQLLGNLPIVHGVGGLIKVLDEKTGFVYDDHLPAALAEAMQRALLLHRDDPGRIVVMQQAAIEQIVHYHTWKQVMSSYVTLYEQAIDMICGS